MIDADQAGHASTANEEVASCNAFGELTVAGVFVPDGERPQDAVATAWQAGDSAQAEAGVDNPVSKPIDGTGRTVTSDAAFLQQWSACPITKVCLLLFMHTQLLQGCFYRFAGRMHGLSQLPEMANLCCSC